MGRGAVHFLVSSIAVVIGSLASCMLQVVSYVVVGWVLALLSRRRGTLNASTERNIIT